MIENHMVVGNENHDAPIPPRYLAMALDDVVDTVMCDGQWPRRKKYANGTSSGRAEFSLFDWIQENYSPDDIACIFQALVTNFDNESDMLRIKEADRLEKSLRDYFTDSEIVIARANELMDDDK